jgi:hypothetical protein
VGITDKEESRVKASGSGLRFFVLAAGDSYNCRRNHVKGLGCDDLRTECEVVRFPFVVVIEDGHEQIAGISRVPPQPFQACVPGSRRSAGSCICNVNDAGSSEPEVVDDVPVVRANCGVGIVNDDEKVRSAGLTLYGSQ